MRKHSVFVISHMREGTENDFNRVDPFRGAFSPDRKRVVRFGDSQKAKPFRTHAEHKAKVDLTSAPRSTVTLLVHQPSGAHECANFGEVVCGMSAALDFDSHERPPSTCEDKSSGDCKPPRRVNFPAGTNPAANGFAASRSESEVFGR